VWCEQAEDLRRRGRGRRHDHAIRFDSPPILQRGDVAAPGAGHVPNGDRGAHINVAKFRGEPIDESTHAIPEGQDRGSRRGLRSDGARGDRRAEEAAVVTFGLS